MLRDLRYAVRALSKSPGFAMTSMFSLALGIAASTVVFGIIHGINFQPLPYRDADRLVELGEFLDQRCAPACLDHPSIETVSRWRERTHAFDDVATAALARFQMGGPDSAGSVLGAQVEENFFPVLGVQPVLGRPLLPSDFGAAEPDVVIGRRLWARRFGERRDILGATLRLDGTSYTIVGVVPSDFAFPVRAELWVPQPADRSTRRAVVSAIARLKPGVSIEQARGELGALSRTQQVDEPGANAGRIGTALSLRATAQGVAAGFWMLLGAVGAALLIACANVISLSLVRGLARTREMAVRRALGASQWRLVLPSVSEGLLVALGGAAGGVLLALWTQPLVATLIERVYNYPIPLVLNLPVLAVSVVLSIVIGVLIGLVPGLGGRDVNVHQTLREAAVTTTATRGARRLRVGLVVGEIAAALVLLAGAGLLAASFSRIRHYDLGYDAERVISAPLSFPEEGPSAPLVTPVAAQEIVARAQLVTGGDATIWTVSYPRAAARSPSTPFDEIMSLDGRQANLTVAAVPPVAYHVSPGFFQATGIRLVRGRSFTTTDDASADPVGVVNEEAARLWWPGEEALGRRFRVGQAGGPGPWVTVVGIAANTHLLGSGGVYGGLANPGYFPLVFRPLAQSSAERSYRLALRPPRWGSSLAATLRHEVQGVVPGLRLGALATLRDLATDDERFAPVALDAQLIGGLAVFGVFLALIGIYGLVADVVRRRTHEIGIRIALGASPRNVLALVLKDAVRFAAAGIALGVVGTLLLGGVLRSLLFGMSPTNPAVYGVVCVTLAVVVAIASYLPARQAAKVDPMVALRCE